MIGNAAPAARLTGQNVRGLSQLKLEKVLQFMKERRLLVTCLMETWQVTPQGWYSEDIDGFLVIHHGETAQSCNRGRSGVAIILSPEARAAWELGCSWVQHSSNEMTYGRSLQRHLNHFDLPTVFTEWAHLAQDRAGWHKLVTTPPFAIGKPFVRQPRGDTRVTPEDKRRAVAQRAAEIAERRAVFDANNNN